ncbi:putative cytokinetic ring protein SteA [Sanguibacter sp. 4.1]|uniref:Cytokinetic ring protein SteA n=1 Tax=Sanguibacter biliveldensis TaxID=3030830 RepID=A0AAF0Z5C1_9MICO|nr:putative cytokinetic ring protein SteA [Sanguibacter sp. 4.1]WPF80924.1 putative cytokinetic ring protein SteA [Sanguibacter sp. 4.1]
MKLRRRSTAKDAAHPQQGVSGTAKVDRRTKDLTKRLRPGDIAVIDHLDIDRVAAEALVAAQPAAVLNAAKSISGRYPNLGPSILVDAGVVLVDDLGADIMSVREGKTLRIEDGAVYLGDTLVTEGVLQDAEKVGADLEEAREGLSAQLESFAANTMDYLRRERDLLLDGVGIPAITTKIAGRQVLIVVRGYHYREDLQTLRSYIKEFRPILIGVDGGADAIIEAGWQPDLIVGDMDSVSDKTLRCGAEVVIHAYRDGRAPGLERVEALGVPFVVFPAAGTSEDIAMLLADDMGAEVIVAVGTHATLVEFLDKGRAGMASTFLTRLRVGGKLVDAKGVSRLYRHRISTAQLVLLAVAGLAAVVAAMVSTSVGQTFLGLTGARMDDLWSWVLDLAWWT